MTEYFAKLNPINNNNDSSSYYYTALDCFSEGSYDWAMYANGSAKIQGWLAARGPGKDPYAYRPSFRAAASNADVANRVGGHCRFWDDSEFLGSIPKVRLSWRGGDAHFVWRRDDVAKVRRERGEMVG